MKGKIYKKNQIVRDCKRIVVGDIKLKVVVNGAAFDELFFG